MTTTNYHHFVSNHRKNSGSSSRGLRWSPSIKSDEEDKDNDRLETQMHLEPRYVFFLPLFLLLTIQLNYRYRYKTGMTTMNTDDEEEVEDDDRLETHVSSPGMFFSYFLFCYYFSICFRYEP